MQATSVGLSTQAATVALSVGMGLAWGVAWLGYTAAFKAVGGPSLALGYLARLALNPWFMAALVLSLGVAVARLWLFDWLGATRAYWAQPLSFVATTAFLAAVLRDRMEPAQWAGAALILLGVWMVSR